MEREWLSNAGEEEIELPNLDSELVLDNSDEDTPETLFSVRRLFFKEKIFPEKPHPPRKDYNTAVSTKNTFFYYV